MNHAVAVTASSTVFGVGVPLAIQVLVAVLDFSVGDAWAAAGDET